MSRSYASWSCELAAALEALIRAPHDELERARARRLLERFAGELAGRIEQVRDPEVVPQSIRAELAEITAHPEIFFGPGERP